MKCPLAVEPLNVHQIVSTLVVVRNIGPRVEFVDLEHGGILPLGEGLRGDYEAETGKKKR